MGPDETELQRPIACLVVVSSPATVAGRCVDSFMLFESGEIARTRLLESLIQPSQHCRDRVAAPSSTKSCVFLSFSSTPISHYLQVSLFR